MADEGTEKDRDIALMERYAAQLMEHFDAVQIFASRQQPGDEPGGETVTCNIGRGNVCARSGQVREWLIREDERLRIEVRREDSDDE